MKYPLNETIWVKILDEEQNLRYIITSKASREFYFIYEFVDGKFIKLGKSKSPTDLEKKFLSE